MSDNKKYYYLKLKDNFFDQDSIRILESQENGYIHSLIILKLYLKACKYDGQLKMTETIPYSPDDVDTLAGVIGHDVDHVKIAISKAVKLGLVTVLNSGDIWMTEIQNFIGHTSTEADRVRAYRKKLKTTDVQMYDKSTPETERETDINTDIETPEKGMCIVYYYKNEYFSITERQHFDYKNKYPNIDLDNEYLKMKVWLDNNPDGRKKDSGKFISDWLGRKKTDSWRPQTAEDIKI